MTIVRTQFRRCQIQQRNGELSLAFPAAARSIIASGTRAGDRAGGVVDSAQAFVTALNLSIRPSDDFHQFRDLAALIGLVAAIDRVLHAMGHVIPEDLFLDAAKRRPHRRDLGDDIDAVSIPVDHFREPANLAFNPVQAFFAGGLDVVSHSPYIPP
jgi:hypothetical protein